MIPVIQTKRLTLGPITTEFVEAFAAFCQTDRSKFLGGPTDDPDAAWESCTLHAGHWVLRGYGGLQMALKDGTLVGRIAIWHPRWIPEPELSWVTFEDFEGQGYAYEAATALRDWMAEEKGIGPLMSLIDPENARSIKLAERLGATREGTHTYEHGKTVDRYRHQMPEAA